MAKFTKSVNAFVISKVSSMLRYSSNQQTGTAFKKVNNRNSSYLQENQHQRRQQTNSKEITLPTSSSLTDTFGRHHTYLRISLTEKCNLRCEYCMPSDGVQLTPKPNLLSKEEIIYLTKIFANEGITKIRLTGGEPTIRKDIVEIIEKIKSIPKIEHIGITTNGLLLTRLLCNLQRAGLNSLNISLDTLKAKKFENITRRKGWERVIAGIDLAINLGYKPKINCVLMRNFNEDEICDFVEFTKDRNVDIRFIEYMPFKKNKWQTEKLISYRETLEIIRKKWPNLQELENGPNDTSKAFTIPNYIGQIGFITSMTEHFCGTCNRLRLTADGNLKVCLFGNKEFSLRDAIRSNCSEENLTELISVAVKKKKKQHAGFQKQISSNNYLHKYSTKTQNIQLSLFKNLLSSFNYQQLRFCHLLTHVNEKGKSKMVDISEKESTYREAKAKSIVIVGPKIAQLIKANQIAKGDVLSLVQLAGIMGAKKTSDLIPLCHNISLNSVDVNAELDLDKSAVLITAIVRCSGKTGVEMEALTAVSIAALTVYDMCKAISHEIIIKDIRLIEKSGGKSYFHQNSS